MGATFNLYKVIPDVEVINCCENFDFGTLYQCTDGKCHTIFDLSLTRYCYKKFKGYKRYEKRLTDIFSFNYQTQLESLTYLNNTPIKINCKYLMVDIVKSGMCYPKPVFFKKKFNVIWCVSWIQIDRAMKKYFNLKKAYNKELYNTLKSLWAENSGMFFEIIW